MTYVTTWDSHAESRLAAATGQVLLTQAEFEQVIEELESLRNAHREHLAERLRHARGFGVAGDNDDQLAVYEDAVVDEVRIAQLERLVASTTVVDGARAGDDTVGLGSVVRVEGPAGRRVEYELVGVRVEPAFRPQITAGSPMGQALLGARAGATVRVTLPNGQEREITVLDVFAADEAPDRQLA